jgi:hypothetical protein
VLVLDSARPEVQQGERLYRGGFPYPLAAHAFAVFGRRGDNGPPGPAE